MNDTEIVEQIAHREKDPAPRVAEVGDLMQWTCFGADADCDLHIGHAGPCWEDIGPWAGKYWPSKAKP